MVIGETLHRALAKLVMRAAGDQEKTACGNLQLCTGLETGIEGAIHAIGQWILKRSVARQRDEEARSSDEEEDTESEAAVIDSINKETVGTEEEAVEDLEVVMEMDIKEVG